MNETPWMTKKEAAGRLKVTTRTIERLVTSGQLKKHTVGTGRAVRFKAADVEALLTPQDTDAT